MLQINQLFLTIRELFDAPVTVGEANIVIKHNYLYFCIFLLCCITLSVCYLSEKGNLHGFFFFLFVYSSSNTWEWTSLNVSLRLI